MSYQNIKTELHDEILYITINRESKLNALNKETLTEVNHALQEARVNKNIGGIIITGAGEKAFVAGADISEFANFNVEEGRNLAKQGQESVFDFIANYEKPVIAAINGFALGGGLELAMACHLRIASSNAKLGLPEVSLGLIPGYGGTQRLTQLVGKGKAMELILSAEMIAAETALSIGLVNKVVPLSDLKSEVDNLMHKILQRSPKAITSAIKAINAADDPSTNGFIVEIDEFGKCFQTADFVEGTTAFLEKRKPNFVR